MELDSIVFELPFGDPKNGVVKQHINAFRLLVVLKEFREVISNLQERVSELEGREALHEAEIERTLEVIKQIDRDNEDA